MGLGDALLYELLVFKVETARSTTAREVASHVIDGDKMIGWQHVLEPLENPFGPKVLPM
jgi:hypothetical protein